LVIRTDIWVGRLARGGVLGWFGRGLAPPEAAARTLDEQRSARRTPFFPPAAFGGQSLGSSKRSRTKAFIPELTDQVSHRAAYSEIKFIVQKSMIWVGIEHKQQ